MRIFTTEGPVRPEDHYSLPPLERWDLDEILTLIDQKKYFLLHAPRKTGKTTCLLALLEHLNRDGRYRAVYASLEGAKDFCERIDPAMARIVTDIAAAVGATSEESDSAASTAERLAKTAPVSALGVLLSECCQRSPKPMVLMLDDVDALVGDTLNSLLRQLRAGFPQRPTAFPHSVILCGVHKLRNSRIHSSSGAEVITGGSGFNILAKSLRLSDFTAPDVETLLTEHTAETGQAFTPEALARVWELTLGQPWLVNALAFRACFEMPEGRDRSRPMTAELIDHAKEAMVAERLPHLDQLAHTLSEPRVRHVIEPILAGTVFGNVPADDIQDLVELGLLRRDPAAGLVVANPIYREVLPRALARGPQDSLPQIAPTWLNSDGSLNPERLLDAFLAFWRQHGQPLLSSTPYHEIAPHLVLMAFLHRVINGGGTLERDYAIGMGRMDLCLRYGALTVGMELKVWRDGASDPLTEGLEQLDGYLAGLGLDGGWLVIFDRRAGQPPIREHTAVSAAISPQGRPVQVVRD